MHHVLPPRLAEADDIRRVTQRMPAQVAHGDQAATLGVGRAGLVAADQRRRPQQSDRAVRFAHDPAGLVPFRHHVDAELPVVLDGDDHLVQRDGPDQRPQQDRLATPVAPDTITLPPASTVAVRNASSASSIMPMSRSCGRDVSTCRWTGWCRWGAE